MALGGVIKICCKSSGFKPQGCVLSHFPRPEVSSQYHSAEIKASRTPFKGSGGEPIPCLSQFLGAAHLP